MPNPPPPPAPSPPAQQNPSQLVCGNPHDHAAHPSSGSPNSAGKPRSPSQIDIAKPREFLTALSLEIASGFEESPKAKHEPGPEGPRVTLYVQHTDVGPLGEGTKERPYASVATAVEAAEDHSEIVLLGGHYPP